MALYTTTGPAPLGAISTFRVVNAVETAVHKAADWNRTRQTKSQLSKLTDWELADIGIERHEIDAM